MRLISVLAAVCVLSGCALGDEKIAVAYVAPANLTIVDGANAVTLAVNVQDGRASNRDRIGSKKNGYGMETARILAANNVIELVRTAVEHELESLGFNIGPGGYAVNVEVQTFYNDFKTTFFKLDAVAEVALNLTALNPDGTFAYSRSYKGIGMNQSLVVALPSTAQPALEQALTNAMEQLIQDDNLHKTLVAAAGTAPALRRPPASPVPASTAVADATASAGAALPVTMPAPLPSFPLSKIAVFKAAEVGTRFYLDSGGYFEIASTSGNSVTTVNASLRQTTWAGLFFTPGIESQQFPVNVVESIWPLEVGKSVSFDLAGMGASGATGSWTETIEVLRHEEIATDAGRFQTIVVETRERSRNGNFSSVKTQWYAPAVGFIVRSNYRVELGSGRPWTWTVTRIAKQSS